MPAAPSVKSPLAVGRIQPVQQPDVSLETELVGKRLFGEVTGEERGDNKNS